MKRKILSLLLLIVLAVCFAAIVSAQGRNDAGLIYVTSQGLYYETFVTVDPLPFRGSFQELEPGPNGISQTEFGPGDAGYLGGRWWEDTNGNGEMDADDHYFLCPLLGPGRSSP
jgi:hypothetical protein